VDHVQGRKTGMGQKGGAPNHNRFGGSNGPSSTQTKQAFPKPTAQGLSPVFSCAGSVCGFYYARIADPCYGKRAVERVSEPVLRKRKEHLSNDQPTHLPRAALAIPAIPEGSKLLAGGKRQRHLRSITSRGATGGLSEDADPSSHSISRDGIGRL
jgi:hypothetical protein